MVPDGDILAILADQMPALDDTLGSLSDEEALRRFAPGEWSIKEVVDHLIDAERIFSYRLLAVSRGEQASLLGFDGRRVASQVPAGRHTGVRAVPGVGDTVGCR